MTGDIVVDDECSARQVSGRWSEAALSVWAKTDPEAGHSGLEVESWFPLVRHLEDSAAIASVLWDSWLSPVVRAKIGRSLPGGEPDGRTLVTWLAGVHDIGKATPGFATKARTANGDFGWLADRMELQGLRTPRHVAGGEPLPPHCRLGQYVLIEWLKERYSVRGIRAKALSSAVGAHHGVPPTPLELTNLRGDSWTGRHEDAWVTTQFEILDAMSCVTGAQDRLVDWARVCLEPEAQMLATAVVVAADWLASDSARFPYGDVRPATVRANAAHLERDLPGPWRPRVSVGEARERFVRRFPELGSPRPIQQLVFEVVAEIDTPSLVVLEAPMGVGKTEAALLAAEQLAAKFGCGGVFVALPTMATSDAMFARVHDWTGRLEGGGGSIFLAHGKARLNDTYRGLVSQARIRGLNANESDAASEMASVSSWLQGRRKGVLANIVVGTIDQVLFGALQTRHVALRHLALASKVVIVDEVHAADVYMRRYLTRVLEWLGAYGVPVVLMSATLPPRHRQQLIDAYARGRGAAPTSLEHEAHYPMVTVQGDCAQRHTSDWTGARTQVRLEQIGDDLDELRELVIPFVEAGACVVVIRNTVQRAQDAFAMLREALGTHRATLLHSRFLASHRAAKERELLSRLGPPRSGVRRPEGYVVVGTQVLEQSLDIDADVMVTDIAPVDLVLQRMGRLHRHRRGDGQSDRPEATRIPTLYVTGVADWATVPPKPAKGMEAVYGTSPLLRSLAVLTGALDGRPVELPTDIPELVTRAYDPDLQSPVGWEQVWQVAEQESAVREAGQRSRADTFRLPEPGNVESLVGLLSARVDDSDEASAGRAQVRDSEDGLEVIVVQRGADGEVRMLPGPEQGSGRAVGIVSLAPPPEAIALEIAASTVRLPSFMTRGAAMDRVIRILEGGGRDFTGWQQSQWLQGQLVLCLDDELTAQVAGWRLSYNEELGLLTDRIEGDTDA